MESDAFLPRDEFDLLSQASRLLYIDALCAVIDGEVTPDEVRKAAHLVHLNEIASWTLTPDEFERLVARPIWDASWDRAEEFLGLLNDLRAGGDLSGSELVQVDELIERFHIVVDAKRELSDLPG